MNVLKVIIGSILNKIPYAVLPRIGSVYNKYKNDIVDYTQCVNKKEWIFDRIYHIVEYAVNTIPFYKEFYRIHNFDISQLKSFDDISKIPIISKLDLQTVPLELRSNMEYPHYLANTGGSTGVPFTFYKSPEHKIKEMAFYHNIWSQLGYQKHKLRFQFVGRSEKNGCSYDFSRNQIRASVYESFDVVLKDITSVNLFCSIEYLQGYPSVLYEFALYCSNHQTAFLNSKLPKTLKGIFLNSEYPNPLFKETIQSVFGVSIIAGYGLTEGCCIGFNIDSEHYEVDQAYAYTEIVDIDGLSHLIGTTYDNFVSPLIRYNTNDTVDSATFNDGILQGFTMNTGGRRGQYILDCDEKRISLTGLIFGKHHKLFDYCSQLQISQSVKGKAIIYYVPKAELPKEFNPSILFDAEGINIEFTFEMISKPIRTKSGKVLLLV